MWITFFSLLLTSPFYFSSKKHGDRRGGRRWSDETEGVLQRELPPRGVVQQLGQLPQGVARDDPAAEGPCDDTVPGALGAQRGAGEERARDEEDPLLVGPHMVRHRRGDRSRHLRAHGPPGEGGRRAGRRVVVRRLRRVRDALRVLLHGVRRRDTRCWGSFAYLRVELGDFIAFIAAGNILLEYVIGGAAVARAWTSYFATLLNHKPNDFRIYAHSLAEDYNRLDPIAVGVIAVICIFAAFSTKGTSRFNYIASIIHVVVIAFIIVAGLTKADTKNLSDFTPFGARGIFNASAVLFFAYVGFDAVSTMAEETKNPAKDIPIGLVGAMSVTTFAYCLLSLTLCLMQPYGSIDPDAPFSVAFEAVGMKWAKYIVAFGALKGMTTVLLVSAVGQARYLTHIARTHMVPPWLANVHERTGTPVNATVVMLVATAIVAFFTDLGILANLLSISTLFIFMLVAVALLVRRYYVSGTTAESDRKKLVFYLLIILGSSVATAAYWGASEKGWIAYVVTVPIWFLSTLALWATVPKAREPTLWGVPLVPWLPSASIAVNIFLLGSIDSKSFMRFGVWTALLLVYYFFFGLHASYDTAKAEEGGATKAAEEGRAAAADGGK